MRTGTCQVYCSCVVSLLVENLAPQAPPVFLLGPRIKTKLLSFTASLELDKKIGSLAGSHIEAKLLIWISLARVQRWTAFLVTIDVKQPEQKVYFLFFFFLFYNFFYDSLLAWYHSPVLKLLLN